MLWATALYHYDKPAKILDNPVVLQIAHEWVGFYEVFLKNKELKVTNLRKTLGNSIQVQIMQMEQLICKTEQCKELFVILVPAKIEQ